MGRLTTHVLDTARGKPASSVPVRLMRLLKNGDRELVNEIMTNNDGRSDRSLLEGPALSAGIYELSFDVESYFSAHRLSSESLAFYDIITIRVRIIDPDAHYHVPLLLSPWSYSTYRGS